MLHWCFNGGQGCFYPPFSPGVWGGVKPFEHLMYIIIMMSGKDFQQGIELWPRKSKRKNQSGIPTAEWSTWKMYEAVFK